MVRSDLAGVPGPRHRVVTGTVVMLGLAVLAVALLGSDGLGTAPYLIVVLVMLLGARAAPAAVTATSELAAEAPDVRALIVTTFGRPGYLRRAMRAGARGFMVKDTPARELADAVRRVHSGLRVLDPVLAADALVAGESPLTPRETEVLVAAQAGGSVADIPRSVHLSEGTVRDHLSASIVKTLARNRADAVRVAEENGWL